MFRALDVSGLDVCNWFKLVADGGIDMKHLRCICNILKQSSRLLTLSTNVTVRPINRSRTVNANNPVNVGFVSVNDRSICNRTLTLTVPL